MLSYATETYSGTLPKTLLNDVGVNVGEAGQPPYGEKTLSPARAKTVPAREVSSGQLSGFPEYFVETSPSDESAKKFIQKTPLPFFCRRKPMDSRLRKKGEFAFPETLFSRHRHSRRTKSNPIPLGTNARIAFRCTF